MAKQVTRCMSETFTSQPLAIVQYQSSLPAVQSEQLQSYFGKQASTEKTPDGAPNVALMLFKTASAKHLPVQRGHCLASVPLTGAKLRALQARERKA